MVPRDRLFEGMAAPHGFGTEGLAGMLARIRQAGSFKLRSLVENDPSLKQIIPYMVVTDGEKILLLRRRSGQTEARLRNLYSIGVGGHINPQDDGFADPVEAGLRRELSEELLIAADPVITPLGYLNDDTNPVGSVHFGLVFRVEAPAASVSVAEKDMMDGSFADLKELVRREDGMETWSRLLLDYIKSGPESVLGRSGSHAGR